MATMEISPLDGDEQQQIQVESDEESAESEPSAGDLHPDESHSRGISEDEEAMTKEDWMEENDDEDDCEKASFTLNKDDAASSNSSSSNGDSPEVNEYSPEVVSEPSQNSTGSTPLLRKIKLVRRKRKPSRFQDSVFDIPPKLMNINRDIPAEVFEACHKKPTTTVEKPKVSRELDSETNAEARSKANLRKPSTPVYCAESAGRCVTFDEEGYFRFKVCKEHVIQSKIGGVTSYRCDICDMLFPRSFSLRRHYERIHVNPRFVRNKGKKDQERVRILLSSEDKKEKELQQKGKDFRGSTNSEVKENSSYFLYACKLCRQQPFFMKKDQLRRHHQTKHIVSQKLMDSFKCESCDRCYATRHELRRHKRTHSGERPYACKFCAKRFPTSTNARRHERTHTGDRPHICKVCNKGFIQKTDMAKHLRSIHKMKVTKTKAERAGKKVVESAITKRQEEEVEDKSNQFEENIDFAAYLKLDQFESGTLMGGATSEPNMECFPVKDTALKSAIKNSSPTSNKPVTLQSSAGLLKDAFVTVGEDGRPTRSHRCPECSKSFTSRVNMQRHFRLKHERNKVVRSALPVSMVVTKFKIQEEAELAATEEKIEDSPKNDPPDAHNEDSSLDPPAPEKIDLDLSSVPSCEPTTTSTPTLANAGKSVKESSVSITPLEKTLESNRLPPRPERKLGSKIGRIVERLSSRKNANVSQVSASASSFTSSPEKNQLKSHKREENLISSDTLLQSMKRSSAKPTFSPPSVVPTSIELKEQQKQQNSAQVHQRDFKMIPRFSSEHFVMQPKCSTTDKQLFNSHSQIFSGAKRERNQLRHLSKNPHPHRSYDMFRRRERHERMPTHPPSVPHTVSHFPTKIEDRFLKPPSYFFEERSSPDVRYSSFSPSQEPRSSNVFDRPEYARMRRVSAENRFAYADTGKWHPFTDERINTSMDHPHGFRQCIDRPTMLDRSNWDLSPPPRPKPPHPACFNEVIEPPDVALDCSTSKEALNSSEEGSSALSAPDIPLDLTHPDKKPSAEYVVTKDGILDFSMKTRNALKATRVSLSSPSVISMNSENIYSSPTTYSGFPDSQFSSKPYGGNIFQVPDRKNFGRNKIFPSPSPDIKRVSGWPSAPVSLKFHNVKFDKGRQIHGSGTAGRPLKACSDVSSAFHRIEHHPQKLQHQLHYRSHFSRNSNRHGIPRSFHHRDPHPFPDAASSPAVRMKRNLHDGFMPFSRQNPRSFRSDQHYMRRSVAGPQSHASVPMTTPPPRYTGFEMNRSSHISPSSFRKHHYLHRMRGVPSTGGRISRVSMKQSSSDYLKNMSSSFRNTSCRMTSSIMKDNSLPLAGKSNEDIEKEVMMRCIKKAQNELKLCSTANVHPFSCSETFNPVASQIEAPEESSFPPATDASLQYSQVGEGSNLHSSNVSEESASDFRKNKLGKESPVRFVASSSAMTDSITKSTSDTVAIVASRNKLTSTPGFDTNGEDSSRDGDANPASPDNLTSANALEGDEEELGEDLIPESTAQASFPAHEETTSTSPSSGYNTVNRNFSEDNVTTSAEAQLNSPSKLAETEIIKDDANKETTSISTTSPKQQLGTDEVASTPVSVQFDENLMKANEEQSKLSSPKKFIQKLKLRAVKSQENDGTKKWTLVEEKPEVEENPDSFSFKGVEEDSKSTMLSQTSSSVSTFSPSEIKNENADDSPDKEEEVVEPTPLPSGVENEAESESPNPNLADRANPTQEEPQPDSMDCSELNPDQAEEPHPDEVEEPDQVESVEDVQIESNDEEQVESKKENENENLHCDEEGEAQDAGHDLPHNLDQSPQSFEINETNKIEEVDAEKQEMDIVASMPEEEVEEEERRYLLVVSLDDGKVNQALEALTSEISLTEELETLEALASDETDNDSNIKSSNSVDISGDSDKTTNLLDLDNSQNVRISPSMRLWKKQDFSSPEEAPPDSGIFAEMMVGAFSEVGGAVHSKSISLNLQVSSPPKLPRVHLPREAKDNSRRSAKKTEVPVKKIAAMNDHNYMKSYRDPGEHNSLVRESKKSKTTAASEKAAEQQRKSLTVANDNEKKTKLGRSGTKDLTSSEDLQQERIMTRSSTGDSSNLKTLSNSSKNGESIKSKRISTASGTRVSSSSRILSAASSVGSSDRRRKDEVSGLRNLSPRLNIARVLSPVRVQAKRGNVSTGSSSLPLKRRSIRKYSKNFTASKKK